MSHSDGQWSMQGFMGFESRTGVKKLGLRAQEHAKDSIWPKLGLDERLPIYPMHRFSGGNSLHKVIIIMDCAIDILMTQDR